MTLNLDLTAPVLVLDSPGEGDVVGASPVTLTGTVSEPLSGLTQLTCNGVPAGLAGEAFTCLVDLVEGPNTLVVGAIDAAGNVTVLSREVELAVFTVATSAAIEAVPEKVFADGIQTATVTLSDPDLDHHRHRHRRC